MNPRIGRGEFRRLTGREPVDDDQERINCNKAGQLGHMSCGWCPDHNLPRWECLCKAGMYINGLAKTSEG